MELISVSLLCDVETGKTVCLAYTFDFDKGDDRLDGDLAKMVDDGRMRMADADLFVETRELVIRDPYLLVRSVSDVHKINAKHCILLNHPALMQKACWSGIKLRLPNDDEISETRLWPIVGRR